MYDVGQSKLYLKRFAALGQGSSDTPLVLGATALDDTGLGMHSWENAVVLGEADSLHTLKNLAQVSHCLVVSPSGLAAARWLEKEYGIPYQTAFPASEKIDEILSSFPSDCGRVLILHQQFAANALREKLHQRGICADVGTWFLLDRAYAQQSDLHFDDEDRFIESAQHYDTIVCDPLYWRALEGYGGKKIAFPHFAVSGDLYL